MMRTLISFIIHRESWHVYPVITTVSVHHDVFDILLICWKSQQIVSNIQVSIPYTGSFRIFHWERKCEHSRRSGHKSFPFFHSFRQRQPVKRPVICAVTFCKNSADLGPSGQIVLLDNCILKLSIGLWGRRSLQHWTSSGSYLLTSVHEPLNTRLTLVEPFAIHTIRTVPGTWKYK